MTYPMDMPPLVMAAHGTRDAEGAATCRRFVDRVAARLPGVRVRDGYVELVDPPISEALEEVLKEREGKAQEPRAVVVPLMIGTGSHVREDIPEAIAEGTSRVPGAHASYGRYLGHDPRLLSVLIRRFREACGEDWSPDGVGVVLVGRGTSLPRANADHAALARLFQEASGAACVLPGFIQVTHPTVSEALGQIATLGFHRVVVVPNFLFPGRLRTWTREQSAQWAAVRAAATGGGAESVTVRVAEVIGDCDELADVVVDRYREVAGSPMKTPESGQVYLSGLRLQGRRVLVVGGGHVADRRVPRLLEAGAQVHVVAPRLTARLRRVLREQSGMVWEQRRFEDKDVSGCWYALACTDDPSVNERVAAAAEKAGIFCVRADAAGLGSAWTPAIEHADGLTVAVIGNRAPRYSAEVRDALLRALHDTPA